VSKTSIVLKVIAGHLFCSPGILVFSSDFPAGAKLFALIVFWFPAVLILRKGLALSHFHNWKRETGIVLLCASGAVVFMVFSLTCAYMDDELRKMTPNMILLDDYLPGCGFVLGLAALGWIFLKSDQGKS
jgi:hypothetical protein